MKTEKEKFLNWFSLSKESGLKYIDFFESGQISSEEESYAELNRMIAARAEKDLELFPKNVLTFS